jgi:DNA-binding CsgD family transcriptional regulator
VLRLPKPARRAGKWGLTSDRIELSEQETEVLRRVAKGMTKKETAYDMKLSQHTVDQYLRRAFEKLHVQSLPAAVAAAIRSGLLNTP